MLDDEIMFERANANQTVEHDQVQVMENKFDLVSGPSNGDDDGKLYEPCKEEGGLNIGETPIKKLSQEGCLPQSSISSSSTDASKFKSGPVKVAFVQIKKPITSNANTTRIHSRETDIIGHNEEDPLFDLLSKGNVTNSLF